MTLRTHSVLIVALAAAGFSAHGIAQVDHSMHASPAVKQVSTGTSMAMEEGVVKKIDKAGTKISLAHAAQSGMPAMTMVYRVKDVAWLDKITVGQKIRFATDPTDEMTVVRFEPVK